MEDLNFRKGDAKTDVFGSDRMLQPSPVERIPDGPTTPEVAYQMVKDETFAQTQPRLNLATFVTTYMDDYATKLMNEAININYIDETEYPRIAVMNGKCINIVANLWNSPEKDTWKTGALAIGSSEACMLGGVAGTYLGAVLSDRFGTRAIVFGSMLMSIIPVWMMDRVYSEATIIVNVGLAGFLVVASSAASIVLAQTMLPNNVGMAAGLTIGFSVGLGGLGVTGLGVLADNMGLPFTMQTMTVLTALGALVAFKLPIPESLRKKF